MKLHIIFSIIFLSAIQTCSADIVFVDGMVGSWTQISSPVDLSADMTESDTQLFFLQEQTSFVLPSILTVNTTADGTYSSAPGTAQIAAGTRIDSFLIHMDSVEGAPSPLIFSGLSVTFDGDILGVIGTAPLLDSSDTVVGLGGVTYLPQSGRQTWEGNDEIVISGNTLTINSLQVGDTFSDEIRVIVATPIPEPTSAVLAILGLGTVFGFRRKFGNQS